MTDTHATDEHSIAELKYRYVRYLDTKQWESLADLFTEDATASYGGGAYVYEGREAIMEFLVTNMSSETLHTAHRVGQPEITVSGTVATGRWALSDTVVDTTLGVFISGAAYYEDTYARTEDGWLIATTGYRRLYEYLVPTASMADFSLTASWWATDGRSMLPVT
jgi:ketosteroid isomerase-like protein